MDEGYKYERVQTNGEILEGLRFQFIVETNYSQRYTCLTWSTVHCNEFRNL